MVERMTEGNFCPVSVGGGVRTVEDVRNLLNAGADKVVIGTHAFYNQHLIRECAEKYGSQAICVSIDYSHEVVRLHGGAFMAGLAHPITFAQCMEGAGAGEILLTSIDRDGMMEGYDLDMIRAVSAAVSIPVIASGGCGTYENMYEAIQAGADAVAAGSMFLFTDATPAGAAEYLAGRGIPCRQ